ncbi:MAG: DNA double-strand break repair nuclease NurA [Candidatus Thorarchaeota archaeon]|nr:MAG: DNA double-strand break repair nuclease NurA [Candidatus Thorarchaeota archaeon]
MDQQLDRMLALLVEEIDRVESSRQQFGNVIRKIKDSLDLGRFPAITENTLETSFITKIEPTHLSGLKIAGIDGGLSRRSFRSIDILLTRGIAVIFSFGPDEGPAAEFYPDPFPSPRVTPVLYALQGNELDQIASLERTATELRVILSVLDEFHTDLILLDGSLLNHPRDRPPTASIGYEKFQETIALYKQLYRKARKSRTILVGIIKDSRSTRIVSILGEILPHVLRNPSFFEMMQDVDYRWLLRFSRDTDLLNTFLDEGERTFAFKYSSEVSHETSSLPEDLRDWAASIWVTYLKTARHDYPLRIEVFGNTDIDEPADRLNKALSAILPLSWQHTEYGLPSPIVEADTRARIGNNETQLIMNRLMALTGVRYSPVEKRRMRNPFGG